MTEIWAAVSQDIRTAFNSEFAIARPVVNIAYVNDGFDPAKDAVDGNGNPTGWVRLSILNGGNFQASLGTQAVFRNPGIIRVEIYTALGTGTLLSRQIGEDIATIFRRRRIGGVLCGASSYVTLGRDPILPYHRAHVDTPFQVDSTA